ncbi:MAG TPA: antibiotic biosynthesis monooxygenase [Mycobacteriales bacterium]|nr:antibiotic biosynthesis monooxygenase [Mycobacteriales bacterium]
MIARMWEARARPGRLDDLAALVAAAWPALAATDGFAGGELYRADSATDPRLVAITRWRDEAALAAAAGPGWRDTPVTVAGEAALHARPPHVWHFTPVPLD